jgi:hypothetical protein
MVMGRDVNGGFFERVLTRVPMKLSGLVAIETGSIFIS